MKKSLWLMSAMIVAAPALAQTATPPASTNAAQPAAAATPAPQPATDAPTAQTPTTTQPSTAGPAADTTTTTTSGSGTATTATSTTANPSDAVAAVVTNDWAKYDGNTDSNLSKDEFAKWMTALREQNPAQKAEVKDVNAWTTAAFTQADKDKSGSVSKDELQAFLKG